MLFRESEKEEEGNQGLVSAMPEEKYTRIATSIAHLAIHCHEILHGVLLEGSACMAFQRHNG